MKRLSTELAYNKCFINESLKKKKSAYRPIYKKKKKKREREKINLIVVIIIIEPI